jgi:hypothetical protein
MPSAIKLESLYAHLPILHRELAAAKTVDALFSATCTGISRVVAGACIAVWMLDEEKGQVVCPLRFLVNGKQHASYPSRSLTTEAFVTTLFSGLKSDYGFIKSGESDFPTCSGSSGVAYIRVKTHDGIWLVFTACVPKYVDGDWSDAVPYFRSVGEMFVSQLRVIRLLRERKLVSIVSNLSIAKDTQNSFFDAVAKAVCDEFDALGCSIFVYERFQDALVFGGTTQGLFDRRTNVPFKKDELAKLTYSRSRGMTGWIFSEKKVVRLYLTNCKQRKIEF